LTPLSTIFQLYIVAVSFISGGNRSLGRVCQCMLLFMSGH